MLQKKQAGLYQIYAQKQTICLMLQKQLLIIYIYNYTAKQKYFQILIIQYAFDEFKAMQAVY